MKTLNVYEKGDRVFIRGTVVAVDVDSGATHKYKIKDDKSGMIFGTWYSADEIVGQKEED